METQLYLWCSSNVAHIGPSAAVNIIASSKVKLSARPSVTSLQRGLEAGNAKVFADFPHGCYGNAAFPKCGKSVVGLFFDSEPQFPTLLRAQDEIQNENQHLAQLLGVPLVSLLVFRTWWLIFFPPSTFIFHLPLFFSSLQQTTFLYETTIVVIFKNSLKCTLLTDNGDIAICNNKQGHR